MVGCCVSVAQGVEGYPWRRFPMINAIAQRTAGSLAIQKPMPDLCAHETLALGKLDGISIVL